MFATSIPVMATRTLTPVNSPGCCQFRLKTLHVCILQYHSMDHRVFCFDNVIFGLEEGVLQMQFNVFRLKSGVSGLYLSFEIRVLVSRLHPLNGGRPKRNRFRTPFCGLVLVFLLLCRLDLVHHQHLRKLLSSAASSTPTIYSTAHTESVYYLYSATATHGYDGYLCAVI